MSPPSPHGYDVDHDIGSPSPSPAPPPPPKKTRNAPSRKRFKSPVRKRSPLPKVPKPKPPAPEPYTEKQIAYATSFLNTPSQYDLHEKKDDYTRTLAKVIDTKKAEKAKEKDIAGTSKSSARSAAENKSTSTSAPLKAKQTTKGKKRKEVPLLGAQPKQSIPALKVLNVPKLYQEHGGFDMEEAAKLAAACDVTVEELLSAADTAVPTADIAPKFVYGADLVSTEQLLKLPTHMRNLHQWYLDACKENIRFIVASIPWEYYYRKEEIHIEMNELWQLFNLDALDKSLMSCYCLLKISECKIDFWSPDLSPDLTSPPRRRCRPPSPGSSPPLRPPPLPYRPPSSAAVAEDAAGQSPCGEAAVAAPSVGSAARPAGACGAAAYTLLLRRPNAAGWRWPADLRPAADVGCGVVGSGPEVRIAIHRGCVSSMARGGFAGSSSRLEDVRVFGPGMVVVADFIHRRQSARLAVLDFSSHFQRRQRDGEA
ncbi:hypothetical protein QYE76_025760 [Lolium multiflorum]|uniref:Uncharacterized protein n=1 Tax=Lolium multiflorum TaxID=4521 RepID=A0AAD8REN8_LOLMU|nr:hypothetical protein QYE76_025760 [Lolium multiflorum]